MSDTMKHGLILLAILALGTGLRLYGMGEVGLWIDEGYSILYTDEFKNLAPGSERGTDSTLFLFLFYFWRRIDPSLFFMRLLPAIFGIATILGAYFMGRRLFSSRLGLWVAGLIAVAPFQVYYSREIRVYSLTALLSLLAMYFMYQALHRSRRSDWALFSISCVLLIYTHYATGVFITAMSIFCLVRYQAYKHHLWRWILAHVVMLVGFSPWLLHFLRQFTYQTDPDKLGSWVPKINLFQLLAAPFGEFTFGFHLQNPFLVGGMAAVLAALAVYGAITIVIRHRKLAESRATVTVHAWVKNPSQDPRIFIALLFFGTMFLVAVTNFTPIRLAATRRYFIFASIPYYFLLALGLTSLRRRWIKGVVIAGLGGLMVLGNIRLQENAPITGWIGAFPRKHYDKAFDRIQKEWEQGDRVVHHHESSLVPFHAYRELWGSRYEKDWLWLTKRRVHDLATGFDWYAGPENAPDRLAIDPVTGQLGDVSKMTEKEVYESLNAKAGFALLKGYRRIWYIAGYWQNETDWVYSGEPNTRDFHEEAIDWLDRNMTLKKDLSEEYGFGVFRLYEVKAQDGEVKEP